FRRVLFRSARSLHTIIYASSPIAWGRKLVAVAASVGDLRTTLGIKWRSAHRYGGCPVDWGNKMVAAEQSLPEGLSRNDWHSKPRSEEHTSELQSPDHLVCRLLLEKKKISNKIKYPPT